MRRRSRTFCSERSTRAGSVADRDTLMDLARVVERMDAPTCRGRCGLKTPSVTRMVEEAPSPAMGAASAIEAVGKGARLGGLAM